MLLKPDTTSRSTDAAKAIGKSARSRIEQLEALVVGKSLFQGRIDLGGATAFLSDLNIAQESDTTLTIT